MHFVVLSFDRYSRDDVIGEVMVDLDNIEGAVYIYDYNTGGLLYRLTCPIPDTNGTSNFGNDIDFATFAAGLKSYNAFDSFAGMYFH